MVLVITLIDEIFRREGFIIEPTRGGAPLKSLHRHGVLNAYAFKKKLKDTKSVREWIEGRFERTNPGYSCNILMADGTRALGHTVLRTVRNTY